MAQSAAERRLRAQVAAHTLHSKYDSRELTKNARFKFMSRFSELVDPLGELDPVEPERRAGHARTAYFRKLALNRAKSARLRREGRS